ncbi:MAG: Rho termination factor N-terminal domain-containing protein [Desulfosalsimonas sp.]
MGKKEKQVKEKPLEKMTATELRDIARDLPDITGASGMNKTELIRAIKKAKGIEDTGRKKQADVSVRQIKEKIKELKKRREDLLEKNDRKLADIFRKRISRLKKKTRRVA